MFFHKIMRYSFLKRVYLGKTEKKKEKMGYRRVLRMVTNLPAAGLFFSFPFMSQYFVVSSPKYALKNQ